MRNSTQVTPDPGRLGRREDSEKGDLSGKTRGQSSQQLGYLLCLKVQMSMDF